MPYVTKLLDQKTNEVHILLLQRELAVDTLLSDGVNVARFRVTTQPHYVATFGKDFSLEGQEATLREVLSQ